MNIPLAKALPTSDCEFREAFRLAVDAMTRPPEHHRSPERGGTR